MKIVIQTQVEQSYLEVKGGFDETLFKKLSPPFPPVKLLGFEGSETGDLVTLELNFIFFKQRWVSRIIDDRTTEREFYFIDEGVELPFFLKKWQHKHRVIALNSGSVIRDEIDFQAPFWVASFLLFPALWLQFFYRKSIYRGHFKKAVDQ